MDRSKFSKITAVLLSLVMVFSAEHSAAAPKAAVKKTSRSDSQIDTLLMIYYGHIVEKTTDYLFIEPIDTRISRLLIFVDAKTSYIKEGFQVPYKDIAVGDKVAVRYLLHGNIKLADEVFVVEGEFEPDRYQKRGIKRRSKPTPKKR